MKIDAKNFSVCAPRPWFYFCPSQTLVSGMSGSGGDEFSIPVQSFGTLASNSGSRAPVMSRSGPVRVPTDTASGSSRPRDITEYPDALPPAIDGPSSIRTLLMSRRRSSARLPTPDRTTNSSSGPDTSVTMGTEIDHRFHFPGFHAQAPASSLFDDQQIVLATPRRARVESLRLAYALLRVRDLISLLDASGVVYTGITERRELIDLLIAHDIDPRVSGHMDLPGVVPSIPASPASEQGVPPLEDFPPVSLPMSSSSSDPVPVPPNGLEFLRALEAAVRSISSTRPVEAVDHREPGVLFRFTDNDVRFQFVGQDDPDPSRQSHQRDGIAFLNQLSQLAFHVPHTLSTWAPAPMVVSSLPLVSPEKPITQIASLARTFSRFVRDKDVTSCKEWAEAGFFSKLVEYFNGFCHVEHGSVCDHPLIIASEANDVQFVRRLLALGFVDGVVLGRGQKSALHVASERGHVDVLACLLEVTSVLLLDAACEAGPTPLWAAASANFVGIAKLLRDKGAGVDVPCQRTHTTPLWQACRSDCADVVRLLITAGADVNFARHRDAVTPLWIACASGHTGVVRVLLSCGVVTADCPATDSKLTPVAVASAMGHSAIVRLLLSHLSCGSTDIATWDVVSQRLHSLKHLV